MRAHRFLAALTAIVVLPICPALAQLPPQQTIQLRLRQSPFDPNSNVEFYVVATLEAVDCDSDQVGWSVASMEFFQDDGNGIKSWVEIQPVLDTIDGLWWVTHGDPQAPVLEEFLTTPLLQGVATADDPVDEDLAYEILAEEATPSTPYQTTATVTYALAAADTSEPVKDGTDEPVETHDYRDMD